MKVKNRIHKRRRILAWGLTALAVVGFVLPFGVSALVYESNFGERYATYGPLSRSIDEFEGLQVTECFFESDRGQKLAGYLYCKDITVTDGGVETKAGAAPKGVVVVAHGLGGGGHNSYMDVADFFASNGYLVFAYDATGNDGSEGKSVRGLNQGIIDLDYALRYVKADRRTGELPIVLFGHSWGAYSACSVLKLHPDVRAVVSVSGFDVSGDLLEYQGRQMAGEAVSLLLPYFSLYERLKFGKYAGCSSLNGFAGSDARVMVIHSADDTTVPIRYGYDKYMKKYGDDGRFTFVRFEDRGHNEVYYSDSAREYQKEFNREFQSYLETDGTEFSARLKADYLGEHLDKAKLYELDRELFESILVFYDGSIGAVVD